MRFFRPLLISALGVLWACGSSSSTACEYPQQHPANSAACASDWSAARQRCTANSPCSAPGAQCWYPMAGDGVGPNCFADALLSCVEPIQDGGSAVWRCAQ